jgi:hypothetical protein
VTKAERFQLFIKQLKAAPSADSAAAAFVLISSTLNEVEDKWSGKPFAPNWQDDGRMYPPHEDMARPVDDHVTEYRSFAHNTFIGSNGAFEIVRRKGMLVEISKAGKDGKHLKRAKA